MTKKDYEIIAAVISDEPDLLTRSNLAARFADAFEQDNPRFDFGLWIKACKADDLQGGG